MNRMQELLRHGQSVWQDYIDRRQTRGGDLAKLVDAGLRGLTSNPNIFEKAIGGSDAYDAQVAAIVEAQPTIDTQQLFEQIAVEDIREAADVLRPVFDAAAGNDGYVSLEVSPHLADDTDGTVVAVRRLWQAVDRPNLMIKVPATAAGIPAIETCIADGINVNVTLMFSMRHYEAVAQAYLRGLRLATTPAQVASVASVFVSRVDSVIDKRLEAIGSPAALALRGKAAVANAKMIYQRSREVFGQGDFAPLRARGARVQRVLWGSTGTKNPAYSDLLYVETLIGPDTVNTLPPATLQALQDHGRVADTLPVGLDEAKRALQQLADLGIDLDAECEQLQRDGVRLFAEAYDQVLATLNDKRSARPGA